ncbi:predicted protein [Histoplasma mississippiense (nom. inval.)]|uniref:predicted protein n=1 Tax=Ajellomyces capsulatus (strain NAm1 / WU24) TaxID=2059318 RepID=UPI000157C296|nr:predicted protein [Histoplasma mississippiense (nom. inval.)]EDN07420.1 predicted protein [Histoplasma mississippiense (nom. inval.)]
MAAKGTCHGLLTHAAGNSWDTTDYGHQQKANLRQSVRLQRKAWVTVVGIQFSTWRRHQQEMSQGQVIPCVQLGHRGLLELSSFSQRLTLFPLKVLEHQRTLSSKDGREIVPDLPWRPSHRLHAWLSARRLREQYLPDPATTSYVRMAVDGNLAGNAFACRWKHGEKNICWVTQLVVDRRFPRSTWVLILVGGIEKAPLGLVEANAKAVLEALPIPYIKNARLCGSLFNLEDLTGLVCEVDTGFFVDHKEPLEVVEVIEVVLVIPIQGRHYTDSIGGLLLMKD